MQGRNIVIALLAGMGAITYRSASNSGSTQQPATVGRESSIQLQSTAAEAELAKTFERFDKTKKFTISRGPAGVTITPHALPGIQQKPETDHFNWVIAIVPDPEHSNLKLDFDRDLESLQLAATQAKYQFERYWLPWKAESTGRKPQSYVIHSRAVRDYEVAEAEDDRSALPGVLLFRNPKGALAIFLVSESPTSGIASEEFRNAVRLGRKLARLGKYPDDRLRIIGPGLSGSLATLSRLITTEQTPVSQPFIRTWTEDYESQKRFRAAVPDADFAPLQVDSGNTLTRFISFVDEQWKDTSPMLLLSEESTAFGSGIWRSYSSKTPVMIVPFPRNLSQLRNASEKQDHLPGLGDTSRRSDLPRDGILLSLKTEAHPDLEVPTFSGDQTPVSQESVLFQIGGLLKTNSYHYVGILATDPLDTLFLARYLRTTCPNARIFVISPDVLFEHGSDTSDYLGILAVSSYPLIPVSQGWGERAQTFEHTNVFPNDTAQAVYNAALEVFQGTPGSGVYSMQLKDIGLRNVTDPFYHEDHALWVTIASRNGFEPIAVLPRDGQSLKSSGYNFIPEYWPGWGYLFASICCVALIYCGLVRFAQPDSHPVIAMFTAELEDDEKKGDHDPWARAYYLFAIAMCLVCLQLIWVAVPAFILQQNMPVSRNAYQLKAAGILLLIAGGLIAVCMPHIWSILTWLFSHEKQRSHFAVQIATSTSSFATSGTLAWIASAVLCPPFDIPSPRVLSHLWWYFCFGCFSLGVTIVTGFLPLRNIFASLGVNRKTLFTPYLAAVVAVGALTGCVASFAMQHIGRNNPSDFLAAFRSLDLTNGVSPLLPATFLTIALALSALAQLRRIAYYEDRCPEVPSIGDRFRPGLGGLVEDVNIRIRRMSPYKSEAFVAVLALVAGLLAMREPAQTLDNRQFEDLILAAAVASGCLSIVIWIRLLLLWSAFGEFLRQLERHPIRSVFSLLPRGFVWSPIWQGGGKKRTHVAVVRSVECMEALVAHADTPTTLKQKLQEYVSEDNRGSFAQQTQQLLSHAAMRHRSPRAAYREMEDLLNESSACAVAYLAPSWGEGHYELASELALKEQTKDALHVPEYAYKRREPAIICSELVAFRYLSFINFVLWHIDNFVTYISVSFLLLVVAMNSYAFRSRTIIDGLLVVLFVIFSAGIIFVFAQADRDAILSRITGTEAGKLDRNFFTHVISYGGVPALALLATHIPTVGRFFFSWIKPALEAIH